MNIEIIKQQVPIETLQKKVGGYIEQLSLSDGRMLVFDEDGQLKGKMINNEASALAGTPIAGPAVILEPQAFLD
jgi:hypothetical protein